MKTYFHELPDSKIDELLKQKITWNDLNELYSQPKWCQMRLALNPMGCWSLVDMKGLRKKICEKYCSSCEYFNSEVA